MSDYTCSLDEEHLQKAKSELNEDPETRLIEVANLKKRLEKIRGNLYYYKTLPVSICVCVCVTNRLQNYLSNPNPFGTKLL